VPALASEPELVTQDPNEVILPPSPARLSAARIAIAGSILLALAALTLIFYRSFAVVEPTSAVIVIGDPDFDGAEVVVEPAAFSPEIPAARATLSAENNYQTPVLLRPGVYRITITSGDRELLRQRFRVEAYKGQEYLLGKAAERKLATTRPKTSPATRPTRPE
jgi:hypothetical protein